MTEDAVATATVAALPPAGGRPDHVPFSTGLKKVLELTVRESLRLGHNYVGTEHLLLGLLEARDEPGAQVLIGLGVSKPDVEAWTLAGSGRAGGQPALTRPSPVLPNPPGTSARPLHG